MKINSLKQHTLILWLVLAGGFVFFLTGCHSTWRFEECETINRSFTVSPGGELTMEVRNGKIRIETGKTDKVEVKVVRSVRVEDKNEIKDILEEHRIEMKQTGNRISIISDNERGGFFIGWRGSNRVSDDYTISIPDKFELDLKTSGGSITVGNLEGNAKVKTSGGSINLGQINGRVIGKTSGGSISLVGCNKDVDLKTSGGRIEIGKVTGDVVAHTSGGSISIEDTTGEVDATTSGGSITASISTQPHGDCTLKTSGGSVNVSIAGNLNFDVDAKTSGGRVHSDFQVSDSRDGDDSRRKLNGKINNGGPTLLLRTSGGSIHINRI